MIADAIENYEKNRPPVHAWDTLAPQVEQERAELSKEVPQLAEDHLLTQPPEGDTSAAGSASSQEASANVVIHLKSGKTSSLMRNFG